MDQRKVGLRVSRLAMARSFITVVKFGHLDCGCYSWHGRKQKERGVCTSRSSDEVEKPIRCPRSLELLEALALYHTGSIQ